MKLSDGEKLIILMLSELYEKLGVEGEIEPDFIKCIRPTHDNLKPYTLNPKPSTRTGTQYLLPISFE